MNNISKKIKQTILYTILAVLMLCVLIIFTAQKTHEKRVVVENAAKHFSENSEIINDNIASVYVNRLNEENMIVVGDTALPDNKTIMELMNYNGGLMGYYISEFFLTDLNSDREYEIYTNSHAGSGIIHDFIECYDSKTQKYSIIENRMKIDYRIIDYNNELYIVATDHMMSSLYDPHVYRMTLNNGEMKYESIDEQREDEIMKAIHRTE